MIEKLSKKLNYIFLSSIILFLTIIIFVFFLYQLKQVKSVQEQFFNNQFYEIGNNLEHYLNENESAITNLENSFDMVLYVFDTNGILWESKNVLPTKTSILLETFHVKNDDSKMTIWSSDTGIIQQKSTILTIKGQHRERYLSAMITTTDKVVNNTFTMYMIYPLPSLISLMDTSIWLYPMIWSVAMLLAVLLSRFLVQQAVEPVEKSMESQKEFIAAVSHELKTPISVINAHAEELGNDRAEMVIQNECGRMTRLIQDMLTLVTSDSGNWKIEKRPFHLENVLIDIFMKYEPIACKKKMQLEMELPEHMLFEINGDKDRIAQVLGILLDNAISYSPENTVIALQVEGRKNTVAVSVIDHGPGISDSGKTQVFQRFYREDPSRTSKEHFGLGLTIAKEIIHLHHGNIELKDTIGGGSTFIVTLPYTTTME